MIKNNIKKIILTTLVTLSPIIVGLFLWNKLPDAVAIHWNFNGKADGFSSKAFAVFFMPLFIAAMHLICAFATGFDPKNQNYIPKIINMVLWICPVISIICNLFVYCTALGKELDVNFILNLVLGSMFITVGNYLPKCKQNYTIGIKLPWTLNDEENWNKTHRLGGRVWVLCGIALIVALPLPTKLQGFVIIPVLLIALLVPTTYSYLIYKNKK